MKRTLQVLNELERDGVFTRYAIGGAMGATFYTEPLLTFDLDVFVVRSIVCSGAVSAPTSNPPAVIDRPLQRSVTRPRLFRARERMYQDRRRAGTVSPRLQSFGRGSS